jgi:hypothetical protein
MFAEDQAAISSLPVGLAYLSLHSSTSPVAIGCDLADPAIVVVVVAGRTPIGNARQNCGDAKRTGNRSGHHNSWIHGL